MVVTYLNSDDAVQACYTLKDATYEDRALSGTVIFFIYHMFYLYKRCYH